MRPRLRSREKVGISTVVNRSGGLRPGRPARVGKLYSRSAAMGRPANARAWDGVRLGCWRHPLQASPTAALDNLRQFSERYGHPGAVFLDQAVDGILPGPVAADTAWRPSRQDRGALGYVSQGD